MKVHFLDPPRFSGVDIEKPLDIGGHSLIDQLKQPTARRVQAIVEIEDPVVDVGEAVVHERPRALAVPIA